MADAVHKFVGDQLSRWPLACDNFRALKNVRVRQMDAGGLIVNLQFNPARMISSAAKLSKADIAKRRCFLCRENRPAEQIMIKFEGRKGKKYHLLVNPYPIFPDHLVIAADRHTDQSILHRYVDMLDLARKYDGYTFFYNGPKSGASAPDHHHFQGVPKGLMPLENDVNREMDAMLKNPGNAREIAQDTVFDYMTAVQDAKLYHYRRFVRGVFVIRARTAKSSAKMFYRFLDTLPVPEGDSEPRFNLITYCRKGEYRTIIILRTTHRSHHYFSDGPDHLTMSPGCADMGGMFIASVKEDYDKLTPELLSRMLDEITFTPEMEEDVVWKLSRKQPLLSVGIMSAKEISFEMISDGAGVQKAVFKEGKIEYAGALYDELYFGEQTLSTHFAEPSFILHGVTIGVGFHWERKEDQKFAGALKIIVEGDHLTAVNVIGVEDYLLSVISSEMNAAATEEFLKAHAVISRSWVMARMTAARGDRMVERPAYVTDLPTLVTYLDGLLYKKEFCTETDDVEYVKWYDHEDHIHFDVCADDHCQRYQGLTRATGETVRKVIDQTWGQVLKYDGKLCDARFSKCCGGQMEEFATCWEDAAHPYLQALPDTRGHLAEGHCFCDTTDDAVLEQILNDYDRETRDFFRWTKEFDREELGELIERRSGVRVGRVKALEPLQRGPSGRICKLKIIGELRTLVVGKELEIRRILSESHLKSSAFEVEYVDDRIVLHGSGWGHGVGLCQIGAAVMASEGYGYRDILSHYYPGAEIAKI